MNITILVNNYLDHVLITCKSATYDYYCNQLRNVQKFLDDFNIIKTSDINDEFYYNFIKYQKALNVKNITINKRFDAFKRAMIYNDVYFDFFKNKSLKENTRTFDIIDEHDLKKILKYVNNLEDNEFNLLFKLGIFLLLDTGVRFNELINIKKDNICVASKTILLTTTKTDVDRFCFYSQLSENTLNKLLDLKYDSKYLFYNFKTNEKITYPEFRYFLTKIKESCNIKKLHPHMFRHTFATLLLINDAPLPAIQSLLGHSDIRTTQLYLHHNKFSIQKAYNKYFPSLV